MTHKIPKVSVIITTHNRPNLLLRAINSAQNAGSNVEVIVVDDASNDETAEVCKNLQGIQYIRLEANQHTAGARNVGILASSGEFISFHDDDDIRFSGSIDKQVKILEKYPDLGFCYAPIFFGDDNCYPIKESDRDNLPNGDIFFELLSRHFIYCISVVFRKSCLFKVGMINSSISTIDDWDLWVRISEFYPVKAMNEPIGVWRVPSPLSKQGSSSTTKMIKRAETQLLKLLYLKRLKETPQIFKQNILKSFRNNSSDLLIHLASEWLPKGAKSYARECLLASLHMNPKRALRPWTIFLLFQSILPINMIKKIHKMS